VNRNPLDILEIARDLIHKDEAEHLFKELHDISKEWQSEDPEEFGGEAAKAARIAGLECALNIIDERIEHLRGRWG